MDVWDTSYVYTYYSIGPYGCMCTQCNRSREMYGRSEWSVRYTVVTPIEIWIYHNDFFSGVPPVFMYGDSWSSRRLLHCEYFLCKVLGCMYQKTGRNQAVHVPLYVLVLPVLCTYFVHQYWQCIKPIMKLRHHWFGKLKQETYGYVPWICTSIDEMRWDGWIRRISPYLQSR